MKSDENDFFRQVTMRICGSLETEKALESCLEYFQEIFPVDEMLLDVFDPDLGSIRRVAHVSLTPLASRESLIPIPAELRERLQETLKGEAMLVHDTQLDSFCRAVAPYVKNEGFSEILLPLRIEGHSLGLWVVRARGKGRYSPSDVRLVKSVREPIAIATSNALQHQEVVGLKEKLKEDNSYLKEELRSLTGTEIIGEERGLKNVMEAVRQVAPLGNTVLLLGETGVGKEVVANAIHCYSPRKDGPFVKVNCGAIPETLIDSELFGHEKGAFSGAAARKLGRFERARGGTIFLDEIGELPPQAQVRLLRVLQNREVERVGGSGPIPVDIRVIAATNRNLESMVADNRFREDLWFRLNAFPVIIPPLRRRKEDFPALLKHFLARKSKELGLRIAPPIAPGAIKQLAAYHWPGNVRELENVVERALIQNKGRSLAIDHFTLSQKANGPMEALGNERGCVFPCLSRPPEKAPERVPERALLTLEEVTHKHIKETLKRTGGKIHGPEGAAELLGVNPSTLRNKMNKLGVPYGRRAGDEGKS